MIDDIGIDILSNKRVSNMISDKFINMILNKNEQDIYYKKIGKKQLEFLCGRFCVKEAIIKALNKYENPHMTEIEIINKKNGAPCAIYKNYKLLISISHENDYTIAEAILLK